MEPKYQKQQLVQLFQDAGLNLSSLIDTLTENSKLLGENVTLLSGIMDETTALRERIRILELDVLIQILKKIDQ